MNKKKEILILGAYGHNNIGDELMLSVIVSALKEGELNARIICNSNNPSETKTSFGIDAFYTPFKKDFWEKIRAFILADVIIYGGGSLLVELRMNDLGKRAPLFRGVLINLFAKITRKRVIHLGIGVEDVTPGLSQFLIRACVNLSDACYVRDDISKEILLKYHCNSQKIFNAAELGFNLVPKSNSRKEIKKIVILPVHRILGYEEFHEKYIESLRIYAQKMRDDGYEVVFSAMQMDPNDQYNDRKVIEDLEGEKYTDKQRVRTIEEFNKYIQDFDLVLSSRYHGLIFGLLNTIPVISLTEYQKSVGVLDRLGLLKYSVKSEDIAAEYLVVLTKDINLNYPTITDKIFQEVGKQRKITQEMLFEVKKIVLGTFN